MFVKACNFLKIQNIPFSYNLLWDFFKGVISSKHTILFVKITLSNRTWLKSWDPAFATQLLKRTCAPGSSNVDRLPWFMCQMLLCKSKNKNWNVGRQDFTEFTSISHPKLLPSQELPPQVWVRVSRSSYLLHFKTTHSNCTSTCIIWFLSSLISVSSKSPPESKPEVCCTNLGKIQNINHMFLSSSCKQLKAPQGIHVQKTCLAPGGRKSPALVSVWVLSPSAPLSQS